VELVYLQEQVPQVVSVSNLILQEHYYTTQVVVEQVVLTLLQEVLEETAVVVMVELLQVLMVLTLHSTEVEVVEPVNLKHHNHLITHQEVMAIKV
jgi:hypothetical protein